MILAAIDCEALKINLYRETKDIEMFPLTYRFDTQLTVRKVMAQDWADCR